MLIKIVKNLDASPKCVHQSVQGTELFVTDGNSLSACLMTDNASPYICAVIQKRIHVSFLRHISPADGISSRQIYMLILQAFALLALNNDIKRRIRISVWCCVYVSCLSLSRALFVCVCLPGRHLQSFRGATALAGWPSKSDIITLARARDDDMFVFISPRRK